MPKHLLSSSQTLGRGTGKRKGNTHGRSKSPVKTCSELTAGKHCLPHVSEHSSSRAASTFYLFLLIFIANVPQERGFSLDRWQQPDNQNNNKTQHLVLLKPGPSSSSVKHRGALKPRFIYLYTLPRSLFLATGAHDIVAWDTLEQGSGSPCKRWQQLPPGSSVY